MKAEKHTIRLNRMCEIKINACRTSIISFPEKPSKIKQLTKEAAKTELINTIKTNRYFSTLNGLEVEKIKGISNKGIFFLISSSPYSKSVV